MTFATSERVNGKLVLSEVSREAIKFGATSPLIQHLGGEVTQVHSDGQQKTTAIGTGVYVDGVSYQQLPSGKWEATKAPEVSPEIVENGALADLQGFRRAATGPVVVVGHSVVDGIATTEYRATLSLVKLYYLGQQRGPGLLGSLFSAVDPALQGLTLSLPVEIWADSSGNFIRGSAQYSFRYPSLRNGASTTLDATYTASNFNTPVHAVAPPTKEVTFRPLQAETAIAGKVVFSGVHARAGVLELTITARGLPYLSPRFVAVSRSGSWSLPAEIAGSYLELTPTFYVDGEAKAECARRNVTIRSGLTTRNVDLVCNR
jgi:hypothetical protein